MQVRPLSQRLLARGLQMTRRRKREMEQVFLPTRPTWPTRPPWPRSAHL